MAKKTDPSKDTGKKRLRSLTSEDLKAAVGGSSTSVPGQYKSSSGGGGTSF